MLPKVGQHLLQGWQGPSEKLAVGGQNTNASPKYLLQQVMQMHHDGASSCTMRADGTLSIMIQQEGCSP